MSLPSGTSVRALLVNARWALQIIWSANAPLTVGLTVVTVVRGVVPAGLALFARGLINAFVEAARNGADDITLVLPWLLLGLALTVVEAVSPLAHKLFTQRLHDDVNLRITSDILTHAAKLEVAFFEDTRMRGIIERAQQNTADHFSKFVSEAQKATTSFLQTVSLVAILMIIEPLVPLVLGPFALSYLFFQWRLAKQHYAKEYSRTPKPSLLILDEPTANLDARPGPISS